MRTFRILCALAGLALLALIAGGGAKAAPKKEVSRPDQYRERLVKVFTEQAAFAASARPKLILAGFGAPHEALPRSRDAYSGAYREELRGDLNNTAVLAEQLGSFSPFPGVRETLLEGLLQEELPLDFRKERFRKETEILRRVLERLTSEHRLTPGEAIVFWESGRLPVRDGAAGERDAKTVERAAGEARLGRAVLPRFLKLLEEDSPSGHLVALQARGLRPALPWIGERGQPAWDVSNPSYDTLGERLGDALQSRWNDRTFLREVEKLLDSGRGTPQQRLLAVPFLAEGEDRDTALFLAALRSKREEWNDCRGFTASFSYGVDMGWQGSSAARLQKWFAAQASIVTAEEKKRHPGAGIALRKLSAPPDLRAASRRGQLYLLLEHPDVLPEPWQKRGRSAPALGAGTPLRLLYKGPRLLALDAGREEDAAILRWYASGENEDGDALSSDERCVLIQSGTPAKELMRRLAAWHLTLWEENGDERRFILTRPYTGSFFLAMLPELRGRAASLFLGPGEKIWFSNPAINGTEWYEAAAARSTALPAPGKPLILVISEEQMNVNNKRFTKDLLTRTALKAVRAHPRPGVGPEAALEFMRRAHAETKAAAERTSWRASKRQQALLLLWRLAGTPQEEQGRALLLGDAPDGKAPDLEQVKQLLDGKE